MAIDLTWRNVYIMVVLACTIFSGLVAGTGVMVQWRFEAWQAQMADRLVMFQREMAAVERRLSKLEEKTP